MALTTFTTASKLVAVGVLTRLCMLLLAACLLQVTDPATPDLGERGNEAPTMASPGEPPVDFALRDRGRATAYERGLQGADDGGDGILIPRDGFAAQVAHGTAFQRAVTDILRLRGSIIAPHGPRGPPHRTA